MAALIFSESTMRAEGVGAACREYLYASSTTISRVAIPIEKFYRGCKFSLLNRISQSRVARRSVSTLGAKIMRKVAVTPAESSEGFLLLNSSLKPLFINRAATEILCYSQEREIENLDQFLT